MRPPLPRKQAGLRSQFAAVDEGIDIAARLLLGHVHGRELLRARHDAGLEQRLARGGELRLALFFGRGGGSAVGQRAGEARERELVVFLPLGQTTTLLVG